MNPQIPQDPAIPYLQDALNIEVAGEILARTFGSLKLQSAELQRYRAGRRALISYSFRTLDTLEEIKILGKTRAKGTDERSFAVQSELHEAGFPVPRTLGLVPEFSMWLQEEVSGTESTKLLSGHNGECIATGAANLIKALHTSEVKPGRKAHTLPDEMKILEEKLPLAAKQNPRFATRIDNLVVASRKLVEKSGAAMATTGIHRDFYQDQILVKDDGTLYLLDLDLYCEGEPALDAGNFLAHIVEQSLRKHGDPAAMKHIEDSFFREFAGEDEELKERVELYRMLTLVRHVWISTRIPERREFTPEIIPICEELASDMIRTT